MCLNPDTLTPSLRLEAVDEAKGVAKFVDDCSLFCRRNERAREPVEYPGRISWASSSDGHTEGFCSRAPCRQRDVPYGASRVFAGWNGILLLPERLVAKR